MQNRHALLRIVHGWMSSRFRCNDGLYYPLSVALSPLGGVAAHFVVIIFTNSVKQVDDVIISGWLVCAVVMVTVGSMVLICSLERIVPAVGTSREDGDNHVNHASYFQTSKVKPPQAGIK